MRLLAHELVVQRMADAQRRARHARRDAWQVAASADSDLGAREGRRLVLPLRAR